MTAPVPVGTPTTSASGSLSTSHSIVMPTGVQSGEYLLIAGTFHQDDQNLVLAVFNPGGFWVLGLSQDGGISGTPGGREVFRTWFLLCDGSESGSTVTVTTNRLAVSAMVATRVNPNTVSAIATAGAIGAVGADPPDVAWPSGTYDTLAWTIFWLVDNTPTFAALAPPTGYTLLGDAVSSATGYGSGTHNGHARCGLAYKVENAVTHVDPGAWSGYDASVIFISSPGTYLWRNDSAPTVNEAYWGILAKQM